MSSILILLHCEQNTGYAIGRLENVFRKSSIRAGYQESDILWGYSKADENETNFSLPYKNKGTAERVKSIIRSRAVDTILAFDLPIPSNIAKSAREEGVTNIISYWGASMSTLNTGFKLFLKRLDCLFNYRKTAHLYVFESRAMQKTAIYGRGILESKTTVIPLGVDTDDFSPKRRKLNYTHDLFGIPHDRKLIFYSGHMEERKGVRTIIRAAKHLVEKNNIRNCHFIFCGNKNGESDTYTAEINDTPTSSFVTFAGYRDDIQYVMASCDIGVIASTGWDSFTRSSIEILASGLPLIVSNIGGLVETTVAGETGEIITPGNEKELAKCLLELTNNSRKYEEYSGNARQRACSNFSEDLQINRIARLLKC